jgi:type II secretory pathway pseudopilin PulG
LLIVISILGVLALFSLFVMNNQLKKTRDVKRKSDIVAIHNGLEQYYDTTSCYPKTLGACSSSLSLGSAMFISSLPCDPKTNDPYVYISDGNDCSSSFRIYSNLEISSDPNIKYLGCTYGCGPKCAYNYGASSPNQSLISCPGPTPTPGPTAIPPTPSTTPIQYVCAPGGGAAGSCEPFLYPTESLCPTVYPNDPTCNMECSNPKNRCKNANGKYN